MYKVLLSKQAVKALNDLESKAYNKVRKRLLELETNPRPVGSLKLTIDEGYRIRVGDYRILYEIRDSSKEVRIYKIALRKEVYRRK